MDCLSATLDERIENLWKKQAVKKMLKKEQKIELLLERITVGYDICSALNFLHKNEIVYRDLKPENLGFDIRDDVKLFDFGLSAELQPAMKVPGSKPTTYNLTGETGSFRYMAPEVANSQPYNETADVYAFGILLAYVSVFVADIYLTLTFSFSVYDKKLTYVISDLRPENSF
jgi:serine/threonine protein kinase